MYILAPLLIQKQDKHDMSRQGVRFTGLQDLQTPIMYPDIARSLLWMGDDAVPGGKTNTSSQWAFRTVGSIL